jgi:hypothetical protein
MMRLGGREAKKVGKRSDYLRYELGITLDWDVCSGIYNWKWE